MSIVKLARVDEILKLHSASGQVLENRHAVVEEEIADLLVGLNRGRQLLKDLQGPFTYSHRSPSVPGPRFSFARSATGHGKKTAAAPLTGVTARHSCSRAMPRLLFPLPPVPRLEEAAAAAAAAAVRELPEAAHG
jgi:hypothetical protein